MPKMFRNCLLVAGAAFTCNAIAESGSTAAQSDPTAAAPSVESPGRSTAPHGDADSDLSELLNSGSSTSSAAAAPTPAAPSAPENAKASPPAGKADVVQGGTPANSQPVSEGAQAAAGTETVPLASTASVSRHAPRSALMEEIVVTAQKREEDVQDVPIAINAFSGDQMKAFGVTNPYDLSSVVPGLQATEAVGYSVTYIRGIGTDAFLMADPSVAVYIDDVYVPFSNASNQKFGELQRIEVLKGPQGTLFGRNAVGGAINVVTKSPSFEERGAVNVDLEAATYGERSAKVYGTVPILHNLAVSFSALEDSHDSYYKGVDGVTVVNPNGQPVAGEKDTGAQIKIRYAPFSWGEFNLAATTTRDRGVSGLYSPNTAPSPLGAALGITAQRGFNNTSVNEVPTLGVLNDIFSGNGKFHWDWFDAKLLGSYQHTYADNDIDFDGSPIPLVSFSIRHQFANIYTSEVQLLSNDTSWDAPKLSWIAGAYYFSSLQGIQPCTLTVASTNLAEGRLFGVQIPSSFIDLLNQSGLATSLPSGGAIFNAILRTSSISGYFQSTYHFTDWLALTAGGRFQSETRGIVDSRSWTETISEIQNPSTGYGVLLFDNNNKTLYPDLSTTRFSPKASLEYRPFDNFMAYATYQQATKSGTYNAVNIISNATPIKPEKLDSYEVGAKSELFGGLVKLNGAVFLYNQTDVQVQFVSLVSGGAITFQNAPSDQVKGTDFDLVANLLPDYLNGVYLTVSGAYLFARFTDYPDCDGFSATTGLFSPVNDCSDKKIPRSPRVSGRVGLNKIFPFGNDSTLEVAGDMYYNSGYYTAATNVPASLQPKYMVVNSRMSYTYQPFNLNVTGYVRNITNEQYSFSKLNNDFGVLTALAAPRTVGLQLSVAY